MSDIVGDLNKAAAVLAEMDEFPTGQSIMRDAAAEIERLREALEAMRGAFDTPIARRRLVSELAHEARYMARRALNTHKSEPE